ncbi:ribonuclease domain-containing protein [Amycolatopsis cihanbeyliensis]|uniref:Guanyl-specific ribonuclease Sa n=1 Tax=Amycolatopsis cihanbeyliensis TaxID=1128664 RepID=A0A542CTM1_AMYCI|nr:ribonuclease domain-containing protein [Amycolatopsis cihanbeyliensis]TQI94172.1 guanyl-specific ribonuclease Sa [Amycolatopsis cihanbeyliensis]
MLNRRRITVALVALIVLVLGGWLLKDVLTGTGSAPRTQPTGQAVAGSGSGLAVEPLSGLPAEARTTWELIENGGPFPYPGKDGSVFGNREKLLPQKASGYYHEYTVPTPGSLDRGPRRLVTGESAELYYTADHYESFVVVDPQR